MQIAVCMKWVDTRPDIDPITGKVEHDRRWFAASRADQSALEHALRLRDQAIESGVEAEVVVVCAGSVEAEQMLRDALSAGAARAYLVSVDPGCDSSVVAAAVAPLLAGADLVLCGNWSLDRGTGSFPAFLAHELGAAQALGTTGVAMSTDGGGFEAIRRLDGGRRERVSVSAPGVVSVEAGVELRRAGLAAVLAAANAEIEMVAAPSLPAASHRVVDSGPFRPRSHEIPPPPGDDARLRLMALSGSQGAAMVSQAVHLDPEAAADKLLELLADWGVGRDATSGDSVGGGHNT